MSVLFCATLRQNATLAVCLAVAKILATLAVKGLNYSDKAIGNTGDIHKILYVDATPKTLQVIKC
jgi:hypothetical protein